MLDVLVDSKGRVYSYDPDAVLVQLADGSGQAVYLYDDTATVDAESNVLTSKGPQTPTSADSFTQQQLDQEGYGKTEVTQNSAKPIEGQKEQESENQQTETEQQEVEDQEDRPAIVLAGQKVLTNEGKELLLVDPLQQQAKISLVNSETMSSEALN